MAKLTFSKLGLKTSDEIKNITFNEQTIEIKQYLPVNEKLEAISDVLNNSIDANNFANPIKIDVYTVIAIIENYTNITFTDKQKENAHKLYDVLVSSGLFAEVAAAIPREELVFLYDGIEETIESYYNYKNSAMGIFEAIATDYSNLNLDAEDIREKIGDPENLELLRSVLTKLG